MSIKLCGNCGTDLRCIKTGLRIHDDRYAEGSLFSGDLYGCPECSSTFIDKNHNEYFSENKPEAIIYNGLSIEYTAEIKQKIRNFQNA